MTITTGDYVTIGRNKLTWRVIRIVDGVAQLASGNSSRHRFEHVVRLRLFGVGGEK